VAKINERGFRYTSVYDPAGQRTQKIDPLNRRVTNTYNPDGALLTRLDARGNLTTYLYDANHQLTGRLYPDGSRTTFVYNALGDRTMMANHTGRYTMTYDDLRRKQTVVTPVGKLITYQYDALSRRTQMNVASAGGFTYSYDNNNQLKTVHNPQNDRTTFSYNAAGFRTLKELANGTRATFIYDAANQTTCVVNFKSDNSVISQFNYIYDPVGNKTRIATADGGITTYAYDAVYRLTEEHRTGGQSWNTLSADDWGDLSAGGWGSLNVNAEYRNTFVYDPTGNRLVKNASGVRTTSTFDPANQLISSQNASGRTTYTFDADGNQTLILEPNGDRTTTTWDFENRSILVELPSGGRQTSSYDPDGLRVLKADSTGTTKFLWDGQAYLLETDGSNVIVAVYAQEPTTYGNIISQYRLTEGLWLPSYYHSDVLDSTSELTDADEEVTDTYQYDAWGELLARTGTTVNPFQWTGAWGYYKDEATGLYYIRQRDYLPRIARWTSTDLLEFVNGMNLYLAVFVPNGVDPTGLWRFVSGMGTLSGELGPADESTYGKAGSDVFIQFDPDVKAFAAHLNGTCCDEVKFVQIFYMNVSAIVTTLPNRSWTLDPYRGTPPYYPDGTFRNPGNRDAHTSTMYDTPNFQSLWKYPRPSGLSIDFETCAVCSKATAGSKGEGDVFACVRWGHSFQIFGSIFNAHVTTWKRYIESDIWDNTIIVIGGPPGANDPTHHFKGIANSPSKTMESFLDKYFP